MSEDWTNASQTAFDKSIKAATGGIVNYAGRGNVALPWGMSETTFNDAMTKAIPDAVKAAGGDPAKFPVSSQALVSIGDGRYRLVNGTSPVVLNGKLVDVNLNQTDQTPPRPMANISVGVTDRGARTLAPNLDRKVR